MVSTVPLQVAIYDNPGIKHWSLFIDAKEEANKTIIHLLSAHATKIKAVKNITWNTPVHNKKSDYSCQDFVLDILERLEEDEIIDVSGNYKKNQDALKAKRGSWQ
ncbi:hypothetical protein EMCG_04854 [[Emmonsia] crescens]|uniref:Uncharacterized protein n=1 Tax=[Emmonsia] crescens TaxID=73230 RepID=A0A0G2HS15_9EURO|nr:hypothetical protein EMCG_04854 [Emmonsia crescens UAMH 3008]